MKKFLSVVLVIAMLLSLSSNALAVGFKTYENEAANAEEIQLVKDIYNSLSPEARAIFDTALANDKELLKFHQEYIEPNYSIKRNLKSLALKSVPITSSAALMTANPLTILDAELSSLNLPIYVEYVLKMMASWALVPAADGPLLVCDVLYGAIMMSTVIVFALHWKEVAPKWNLIVAAFKTAFKESVSVITQAFSILKSDIESKYQDQFEDAVNGTSRQDRDHIMNPKHNWNKLFPRGPKWSGVKLVLIKVLQEGKETKYGGDSYMRTLVYDGQTVVVRFVKDVNGFVKSISTAWVK